MQINVLLFFTDLTTYLIFNTFLYVIPVAVFGYNRPDYLLRTLNALSNNELAGETDVFIFIDGQKE